MPHSHSASYLRSHRKRSGLRLEEVAEILGYGHPGEVSRHERLISAPPLKVALQYEALYRTPISVLFPDAFDEAKQRIDQRLTAILDRLKESSATGRAATLIARKFEWAWERENSVTGCLFHPHGHYQE